MSTTWINVVKAAALVLAVILHTLCSGCAGTPAGSVTVTATDPHSGVTGSVTLTEPLDPNTHPTVPSKSP